MPFRAISVNVRFLFSLQTNSFSRQMWYHNIAFQLYACIHTEYTSINPCYYPPKLSGSQAARAPKEYIYIYIIEFIVYTNYTYILMPICIHTGTYTHTRMQKCGSGCAVEEWRMEEWRGRIPNSNGLLSLICKSASYIWERQLTTHDAAGRTRINIKSNILW